MDRNSVGDLRDAFDRGFGPEPAHRPVSDRIEAGHRAVRRRRAAGTLLTVVVATVVGVGAVAVLGDGPDGTAEVATEGTPEPTLAGSSPADVADARYAGDGTLVIDPSVTVVDRIDNPLHLVPPEKSVALDLRKGDQETWVFLTYAGASGDGYGSTSSFESPASGSASFADWVDVMVQARSQDTDGTGAQAIPTVPVRFGEGATLVPVEGVTIVLQQPHPDLPESFAPPRARTAVALVEGPDGRRQWVLARDVGGFDVVKFPASKVGEDLQAFLEFARQQYADGAGLR